MSFIQKNIQTNVKNVRTIWKESNIIKPLINYDKNLTITFYYAFMIGIFCLNIPVFLHLQQNNTLKNYKNLLIIVNFITFGVFFPLTYLSMIDNQKNDTYKHYLFFLFSTFLFSMITFITLKTIINHYLSIQYIVIFFIIYFLLILFQFYFRNTIVELFKFFDSLFNQNDSFIVNIIMIFIYSLIYFFFCALYDFGILLKNLILKQSVSDNFAILILILVFILFYLFIQYACPKIKKKLKNENDRKVLFVDTYQYLNYEKKLGHFQQLVPGFFDNETYEHNNKTFFTIDTVRYELIRENKISEVEKYNHNNENKVDSANYSLAFWLYIDNENTLITKENKHIKQILNFNDKVILSYDTNKNWIYLKSKDKSQKNHDIMIIKTYITQKWNHIVINVHGNEIDFFMNNHLILHNQMPNFYSNNGPITIGEEHGIYHGVIKEWFYFGRTLTSLDRYLLMKKMYYFVQ